MSETYSKNNDPVLRTIAHQNWFDKRIPKEKLVDGQWYAGRCRNSDEARWNAAKQRFEYVRVKFDMRFIEEISAPEDETRYDVFYAAQAIQPSEVKRMITPEGKVEVSSKAAEPASLRPDIFQEARE